jgi:hypothetical protein
LGIVGDVEHCNVPAISKALQIPAEFGVHLLVQCGEGFIEQK